MVNLKSLLTSVCIDIIFTLIINSSSLANYLDEFQSVYGAGYGTEWIYFPDADGVPHYIDLAMSRDEMLGAMRDFSMHEQTRKSFASSLGDIRFSLYHSTISKHENIFISLQNESQQDIVTKILQSNLPLKLLTHGWKSSDDTEDIMNIKSAYLNYKNVSVITIDWSSIASSYMYPWVANKTLGIVSLAAEFLDGLNEQYGVTGDQLHLIGHSLGAHVMGIAAAMTKSNVYRVTGLDLARPFFEYPADSTFQRLDASAAEIVDVIHTCGGWLGFEGAIGTVDFFPNGGIPPQPGCDAYFAFFEGCSHSMTFHYLLESIRNSTTYPTYKCQSWDDFLVHNCTNTGFMGEAVNGKMTGRYYLTTNGTESFNFIFRLISSML